MCHFVLPFRYARAAISRILAEIPVKYLVGLQSVVLTNSMAVGRGKTGRVKGKKYVRSKCLGFHHPGSLRSGMTLNVNQAATLDITLELGSVNEQISV